LAKELAKFTIFFQQLKREHDSNRVFSGNYGTPFEGCPKVHLLSSIRLVDVSNGRIPGLK